MATGKAKEREESGPRIVVSKDGPYLVSGNVPLSKEIVVRDGDGVPKEWKQGERYPDQESYALCRCGASGSKPYCDGSHVTIKFDGTETASRGTYISQADIFEGPLMKMTDVRKLCARAQFCHRAGGVWSLVEGCKDPEQKKLAVEIAGQCPAGRLVPCEKENGAPIEPHFEKSISVTEDPGRHVSGPLWVKGGIPVQSAEGKEYEVRNRVALCRCGKTENKPFCDGTHIRIRFKDGDGLL